MFIQFGRVGLFYIVSLRKALKCTFLASQSGNCLCPLHQLGFTVVEMFAVLCKFVLWYELQLQSNNPLITGLEVGFHGFAFQWLLCPVIAVAKLRSV